MSESRHHSEQLTNATLKSQRCSLRFDGPVWIQPREPGLKRVGNMHKTGLKRVSNITQTYLQLDWNKPETGLKQDGNMSETALNHASAQVIQVKWSSFYWPNENLLTYKCFLTCKNLFGINWTWIMKLVILRELNDKWNISSVSNSVTHKVFSGFWLWLF